MKNKAERRAAALEAIANALLELAAVEREPEDAPPAEILIDRRNCERELGLSPWAFVRSAGREFPAFRVSKRLTSTKEDVLAWLKSRKVEPRSIVRTPDAEASFDKEKFFGQVRARFEARVGRVMTDDELFRADVEIDGGRWIADHRNEQFTETPDDVARSVASKIGAEPRRHGEWRSLGLDVADMEKKGEELRQQLLRDQPEMSWSDRINALFEMWGAITEPLAEARKAARKAAREAKKARKTQRPGPER